MVKKDLLITNLTQTELAEKLGEEWVKRYGGGKNARKPLILNSDKASYIPLGLSTILLLSSINSIGK